MSTFISILAVIGAPLLGAYLWIRLGSSPQGERYMKQRMQGPFVPLDKEDK